MALINCPQCDGIISDKAEKCPHCGWLASSKIENSNSIMTCKNTMDNEELNASANNMTDDNSLESKSDKEAKNVKKKRRWPFIIFPVFVLIMVIVVLTIFRGFFTQKIEISNNSSLYLGVGEEIKLAYDVSPVFADKDVVWSSNNENIATIDSDGRVTTLGNGECTITVTAKNGKMDTCLLNVSDIIGEWKCESVYDVANDKLYSAAILKSTSFGEPTFVVENNNCVIFMSDSTFNGTWSYEEDKDGSSIYKIITDSFDWVALVSEDGENMYLTPAPDTMFIFFEKK